MKAAIETLGCRVNQYESEAISEILIKHGYEMVHFDDYADVYIINTCTVTKMGDKKSRQMAKRAKRINPDSVVAVVGCYSQVSPVQVSEIQGVDIVLGTRNKSSIVYNINKFLSDKTQIVSVNEVQDDTKFEELKIENYSERTRAFIKIQDGCNNFCSYCIIPYARGRICSKKPETIIEEVKRLSENNFKEIILTGISTTSFGKDIEGDWDLLKILKVIDNINGIERIRMGSLDPLYFNDEVIKEMSTLKKLCPHFHLSLQSGCDETLKRMNRHYNADFYENVVNKLRKNIKNCSVTTDIIVGFPGETDKEFNATYEFLSKIKLTKMHIFKYSIRQGTKAAVMPDQVSSEIKEERSKRLIELSLKLEKEFMDNIIGKDMDVLYEQNYNDGSILHDDMYEGYTSNYIKVVTKSKTDIKRKILNTHLLNVKNEFVFGEIK